MDRDVLEEFYGDLGDLSGGLRPHELPNLGDVLAGEIPTRGLYLFFEDGETRRGSEQLRVVRVGTHAVSLGAKSTLRSRLRAHAGPSHLFGRHRSSVFRLHLGAALLASEDRTIPTWGQRSGKTVERATREAERWLEEDVSLRLRSMRVVVIDISDEPSSRSDRAFIEQNAIGLLSNAGAAVDPPSESWLGNSSARDPIRKSGLWNLNHIGQRVHPQFLSTFRALIERPGGAKTLAPVGWWETAP